MKISNSKKQLAKIIHENGGWRDGAEWAAQDKQYCGHKNNVALYDSKPPRPAKGEECWGGLSGAMMCEFEASELLPNWHQTILSRDEYFYLYQEQGLEAALDEQVGGAKPTIEQLAADYHNRKDYADRKQQEADAAKADADAKLAELVAAGKALGLVLSIVDPEPELVINDWRDLRVGDRIWVGDSGYDNNCPEGEYDIVGIDDGDGDQPVGVLWRDDVQWPQIRERGWRFIRRLTKGADNA